MADRTERQKVQHLLDSVLGVTYSWKAYYLLISAYYLKQPAGTALAILVLV
jgi:hypothetical protein